ncbi:unnamed protein product, partial [Mycena citricolor]
HARTCLCFSFRLGSPSRLDKSRENQHRICHITRPATAMPLQSKTGIDLLCLNAQRLRRPVSRGDRSRRPSKDASSKRRETGKRHWIVDRRRGTAAAMLRDLLEHRCLR